MIPCFFTESRLVNPLEEGCTILQHYKYDLQYLGGAARTVRPPCIFFI